MAQELNLGKREDLFAATPPLEAEKKKLLFSLAVTRRLGYSDERLKPELIDIKRATRRLIERFTWNSPKKTQLQGTALSG